VFTVTVYKKVALFFADNFRRPCLEVASLQVEKFHSYDHTLFVSCERVVSQKRCPDTRPVVSLVCHSQNIRVNLVRGTKDCTHNFGMT
jgi:hypothetical protein